MLFTVHIPLYINTPRICFILSLITSHSQFFFIKKLQSMWIKAVLTYMFVNVPSVRLDDFSFNDNVLVYPFANVCPISSTYVVVIHKMSKYTVFVLK